MKPKPKHYIPFYGMIAYFKEYFKADKRDAKDALRASYFDCYQHFACLLVLLTIMIWLSKNF